MELENLHRIDILYGEGSQKSTIFPCQKCGKDQCQGKKECKGFGSYILGVKLK